MAVSPLAGVTELLFGMAWSSTQHTNSKDYCESGWKPVGSGHAQSYAWLVLLLLTPVKVHITLSNEITIMAVLGVVLAFSLWKCSQVPL